MSTLNIIQIPAFDDNYIYLMQDQATQKTAIVDAGDPAPVLKKLEELGWDLDYILNTHHHSDHVGGNLELKEKTGCTIVGPKADEERIPGIDITLEDGQTFQVGESTATLYDVPGHTKGHIAFYFPTADALFCGDTLFSMGCGRLFEGTPEQMWHSLLKFRDLPDRTRVYCAHEYTTSNGQFALSIDPNNADLKTRMDEVNALRAENKPTVPSLLGVEKKTNPFLRADNDRLKESMGLMNASPVEVFTEVRGQKDQF